VGFPHEIAEPSNQKPESHDYPCEFDRTPTLLGRDDRLMSVALHHWF